MHILEPVFIGLLVRIALLFLGGVRRLGSRVVAPDLQSAGQDGIISTMASQASLASIVDMARPTVVMGSRDWTWPGGQGGWQPGGNGPGQGPGHSRDLEGNNMALQEQPLAIAQFIIWLWGSRRKGAVGTHSLLLQQPKLGGLGFKVTLRQTTGSLLPSPSAGRMEMAT